MSKETCVYAAKAVTLMAQVCLVSKETYYVKRDLCVCGQGCHAHGTGVFSLVFSSEF